MNDTRPEVCSGPAFEHRYRDNSDPWNFATSDYEQARFRAIVSAIDRPSYARAFEPGCSTGELSAKLALRCGHLIATDIAPSAVRSAQQRCAQFAHVDIHCADIARELPSGPFDLIVFSEMGYYFEAAQLVSIAGALADRLEVGGDFVAAHWLGQSVDHVLHGDAVHSQLLAHLPLRWLRGERHSGFRIDSWRRT